jgi:hypothetical protein
MVKLDWNTEEYEDDRGFEPVPEGIYTLKAVDAELKETKNGTGELIKVQFKVVEPSDYKNRVIFVNYNVVNASSEAERIGRSQLASWARACGKPNITDTDKLLDRPFQARVDVQEGSGGYGPQNRIRSYVMPKADEAPRTAAPAATKPKEDKPKEDKPKPAASKPSAPAAGKQANPWD